ncbi:tRNA (uracil-5-)-methyltransferase TRM9 [Nannizzia gypsea CBS 118893]|uniref:tRNA (Uracil-5-)-methyltransferase TRM9 n=1 Tax=Arthroderma gypseum (strain ATCC MYA-4604 / CBS 118893) TaxID=535722 RepID=E4UZ25_ARTGP|nr:tRNA (uracil-5-)-methyltransferase TRM9 [Nannizzia gypsea CBS 118893]EFR03355.1 tRNA (uracil-5-)-methyltransferase TRM9 [Nannizzia gypsea CBS 118893]
MASSNESYEEEHVHKVYQEIAPHFSSTRYKPWPIVERFLKDIPSGSVGLDVGCGNGKYLKVNSNIFIVASDRSGALTRFAKQHQPHSAIIADTLNLPHPDGYFDFAISIAVIHHLSLPERRIRAIAAILNTLRLPTPEDATGGKVLIYVWALEQKDSRRGWDADHEQDVMVPWVLKTSEEKKAKNKPARNKNRTESVETAACEAVKESTVEKKVEPTTYLRYYHLYREGELESNIAAAGGRVLEHGYEKDNWWAIACPSPLP